MKKLFLIYLTAFAMVTQPMGESLAQMNKSHIVRIHDLNQIIKTTFPQNKNTTFGDLWNVLQERFDPHTRSQLQKLIQPVLSTKMPQIRLTPIQYQGRETVRVTLQDDLGVEISMEIINDGDQLFKIGDQILKTKDLSDIDSFFERGFKSSKGQFQKTAFERTKRTRYLLTYKEYNQLSKRGKIEYFMNLRGILTASHQVMVNFNKDKATALEESKKQNSYVMHLIDLFIDDAQAQDGRPCVVAGFVSKYGVDETGRRVCLYETGNLDYGNLVRPPIDSRVPKFEQVCGGPNLAPCNPSVFGFREGNSTFCVTRHPREQFQKATVKCDEISPLKDEASTIKLIKGIEVAKGNRGINELFADGKVKEGKYAEVVAMAEAIMASHQEAIASCAANVPPDVGYDLNQPPACDRLTQRVAVLSQLITEWKKKIDPKPPVLGDQDCDEEKPAAPGNIAPRPNPPACPPNTVCPVPEKKICDRKVVAADPTGESFWDRHKKWLKPALIIGGLLVGGIILCLIQVLPFCQKKKSAPPPVIPGEKPVDPQPEPPKSEGEGTTNTTGNSGSLRNAITNPATQRKAGAQ